MDYVTTREISQKWGISERRVRRLLQDGRIEGARKSGDNWLVPDDASKPFDRRQADSWISDGFILNLTDDYFDEIDELLDENARLQPLSGAVLRKFLENRNLEWTYNSNAIEGNTLTLRETQVVLEGITVGGKTVSEHLEAINHQHAIEYLYELANGSEPVSERSIKNIHELILKDIDDENAGRYRKSNVKIAGASIVPPDFVLVPEMMERMMMRYEDWKMLYPIVGAAVLHGELVKIHPFIDGNGRTARLVMNLVLMKYGYQPVILRKKDRLEYYEALDRATGEDRDYTSFVRLITRLEKDALVEYSVALVNASLSNLNDGDGVDIG